MQFRRFRERHFVRFAHAHVDDFRAGIGGQRGAFGALDFFKFINGRGLAVLPSADALGKQILDLVSDMLFFRRSLDTEYMIATIRSVLREFDGRHGQPEYRPMNISASAAQAGKRPEKPA